MGGPWWQHLGPTRFCDPVDMTAPGGTPPGWYPDPHNPAQQRYWDGQAWTENVAALAAPPPPPVQQATYVPAPPPKSSKGCIIALVIVGVLLVLGVVTFFVAVNVIGNKADDFLDEIESDLQSDLSDLSPDTTSGL